MSKIRKDDLCVITRGPLRDRYCTALYVAPASPFNLPDGYPHIAARPGCWVVQMSNPVEAQTGFIGKPTGKRKTAFGSIHESALRPIRDNPGNEQFVVDSRKELTKGKTEISAKGEIA